MKTNNEIKQEIERQLFSKVPELGMDPTIAMSFQIMLRKALDAFEDALTERDKILAKEESCNSL